MQQKGHVSPIDLRTVEEALAAGRRLRSEFVWSVIDRLLGRGARRPQRHPVEPSVPAAEPAGA